MSIIFGKKIKELRLEKGISQSILAEFFNISKMTISAWENNKQEPKMDDIVKIAVYFEVSSDFLLGLEDESGAKYVNSFNGAKFHNNGNGNITIK